MRRLAVCAVAWLTATAPAAAAGSLRAPDAKGPLGDERLSNERTLTRWAHVGYAAPIRSRPASDARRVDRLRLFTEDGFPEVYLALRSLRVERRVWIQVRLLGRPHGRTGWVPQPALGPLRAVTTLLEVYRRGARAVLRRDGRAIWRARIGHGAPGTPTPAGRFYIREKLPNVNGSPIYGPWAFGASAYSSLSDWPGGGVIGIHSARGLSVSRKWPCRWWLWRGRRSYDSQW